MITDLEKKLITVLKKHESDFLDAYKQHMEWVMEELKFLKEKHEEQQR